MSELNKQLGWPSASGVGGWENKNSSDRVTETSHVDQSTFEDSCLRPTMLEFQLMNSSCFIALERPSVETPEIQTSVHRTERFTVSQRIRHGSRQTLMPRAIFPSQGSLDIEGKSV
jgi:hypothetical protein